MTEPVGPERAMQQQIQALQHELAQLKINNQVIWGLLVQISHRLQRSSTSIKTAVSSLLDYDIFWDERTQYEFLQAIDSSTDELADLIILMTLAFRSQAKNLEIETEPNTLQEILVNVKNSVNKNSRGAEVEIQFPAEGRPALVDYQYLSVALGLLIEVILSEEKDAASVVIRSSEEVDFWQVQIEPLSPPLVFIIRHFFEQAKDIVTMAGQIAPESALKLITACRILYLQDIILCEQDPGLNPAAICLRIPTAVHHPRVPAASNAG